MFLAAACAPSRSTLRESESGAPGHRALSLVAYWATTQPALLASCPAAGCGFDQEILPAGIAAV
ncbi:MAG TPA: hypothetical protein VLL03_05625, partial [Burkholderiales bacterium]|nr:hypothetical protein [Burkholderiales bacterium]